MTAHPTRIITPTGLKDGYTPDPGWYITRDRQTLINVDQDGWITRYHTAGDAQPIRFADGDQGTPCPEILNRTIGSQPAYRLTDITIPQKTLWETTCDED
ncbi:MAG: hypothetical protein I3I97_03015 [Bifidobacterium thermophilum]|nr:hypothetical protein [Bifidobacterium thermophilum]